MDLEEWILNRIENRVELAGARLADPSTAQPDLLRMGGRLDEIEQMSKDMPIGSPVGGPRLAALIETARGFQRQINNRLGITPPEKFEGGD